MLVLRIYHGGRMGAHRARERALVAAGVELSLVAPSNWPDGLDRLDPDTFTTIELNVAREGNVNRHEYRDREAPERLIKALRPDLLDIHEEPFSLAARQWLAAAPPDLPVVMYTAQNVDKRFPPPFHRYERTAHARVSALYPCSRQAAAVACGKGFSGLVEVLPIGYDDRTFHPGSQSAEEEEVVLALFGRLVPEKGISDAIRILARLQRERAARLLIVGSGPEEKTARTLAQELGVLDRVEVIAWQEAGALAASYRQAHFVLVPSSPTGTWVEQFGRVIVEGQASGAVVAAYASGSIPEVAGNAALLAEVGDWSGLADGILETLADSADFERRRQVGFAQCAERTWTTVAERQAALYRRVIAGDVPRMNLPRSPARRRALAREEFGLTAATTAGMRPFALPVLRREGRAVDSFGKAIDIGAELRARVPTRAPR